jgi:hypothetical protein
MVWGLHSSFALVITTTLSRDAEVIFPKKRKLDGGVSIRVTPKGMPVKGPVTLSKERKMKKRKKKEEKRKKPDH